jgi:hypothetical protein
MTKKLSIAGLVVAAASSAFAFGAAPAKAACLTASSTTNCATFTQTTGPSAVEDFMYNDGDFIGNNTLTEIKFYQNGFTGLPITLTNIAYSINGGANWLTDNLSSTSYTVTSAYTSDGPAHNLLTSPVGPPTYTATTAFRLRFTIPDSPILSPANNTKNITSYVANVTQPGNNTPQTQTRTHRLNDPVSAAVPGPLPLFGAGAAFAFSRSMRRRIAQSV